MDIRIETDKGIIDIKIYNDNDGYYEHDYLIMIEKRAHIKSI